MSKALDLHNNGDCANTPWCHYCVREEEAEKQQDETLGPCGCVDYHMADCPINTDRFEYSPLDDYDPSEY